MKKYIYVKNKNPLDYKIIKDWINDIKFSYNIN